MNRILKWTIRVSDDEQYIGTGKIVHVDIQPSVSDGRPDRDRFISIWTVEDTDPSEVYQKREVRVAGTGMHFPESWLPVGSVVDGPFVWHVLETGLYKGDSDD